MKNSNNPLENFRYLLHAFNPTIGLLICSDMNKADVQWSFRGISTPMGVATYNNVRIKDMLPTQEQLKERMELLQIEMRETKRLMKSNK